MTEEQEPPGQEATRGMEAHLAVVVRDFQRVIEETSWHAIKYLTLVNGAGAVALLSFMGNNAAMRQSCAARLALFCFFLGIVSVGGLLAQSFHKGWTAFTGITKGVVEWREGKIHYGEIFQSLAASGSIKVGMAFAYLSFVLFIAGALIAILGMTLR